MRIFYGAISPWAHFVACLTQRMAVLVESNVIRGVFRGLCPPVDIDERMDIPVFQQLVSITRVENNLKITGKKAGKAKLQVKTGGKELTCTITLKDISHTNAAGDTRIAVKSSKYSVIFQLNDSQAAKELYEQLPLTLKVENYSDNEKIFYPPKELRTNSTPKSRGSKGSLAYYVPWGCSYVL